MRLAILPLYDMRRASSALESAIGDRPRGNAHGEGEDSTRTVSSAEVP
jgi:hypothetical protein